MVNFPLATHYNKLVPKSTFYKHLEVSASMKRHFVEDVDRIVWTYKFTSDLLNVHKGKSVLEITVFTLYMKIRTVPVEVIGLIDKNLPRHTLFLLTYENEMCAVVNYKEALQGNSAQSFRIIRTYHTDWHLTDDLNLQLEGTSMDAVYEGFVRQIAGEQMTFSTGVLSDDVELSERKQQLQREIEKLKKKTFAERNPTKKFALHKQLLELEEKLKKLI